MEARLDMRLVPAGPQHSDLLLSWVNDPSSLQAKLVTDRAVTAEEHQAWLSTRLSDPETHLWIVQIEGRSIGQVRLQRRAAAFEVDIFIVPDHRRSGLAAAAVTQAVSALRSERGGEAPVEAVVRRENAGSRRLFASLGFIPMADDGVALRYRLPPHAVLPGDDRLVPVHIMPPAGHGWRAGQIGAVRYWIAGRLRGLDEMALVRRLEMLGSNADDRSLIALLGDVGGHFAIMAEATDWYFAAVDRVCSWPVFQARNRNGLTRLSAHAPSLARDCDLVGKIDPDAALSLAMAGYTTGSRTLYCGQQILRAGEYLFGPAGGNPGLGRYHVYTPWKVTARPETELKRQLGEVTLGILRRILDQSAGRMIVVPLSGGYDSRAVVSGLHHLGARNVRCFSYGLPGNFEADVAQRISRQLGYEWRFLPLDPQRQRRFFASDLHSRYLEAADSLCSVPFEQDLPVVHDLLQDGWIDPSAIMVNGNSGDYISGGHIAPVLRRPAADMNPPARRQLVLDSLIGKHYALWQSLMTEANKATLKAMIAAEIDEVCPADPGADANHGIYEFSEFTNRQSKYVISGERVYDFLGLDWELPLWDDDYLAFWADVPLEHKAGQQLYARMLHDANWGGVWRDLPVNRKWVSPGWIRPLRHAARIVAAPLGRAGWHRIEKRLFAYWMELVGNYGVVRYGDVALDRRGHRNAISWHNEAYLRSKGLGYDGRPAGGGN